MTAMSRRGFLGVMLAVAAAPAIVKAENIMKIWTPRTEIITNPFADHLGDDYTAEAWMKPDNSPWVHVAMVKAGDVFINYIDGKRVRDHPLLPKFVDVVAPMAESKRLGFNNFDGYVNDIRLTRDVARYTENFSKEADLINTNGAIYLGKS